MIIILEGTSKRLKSDYNPEMAKIRQDHIMIYNGDWYISYRAYDKTSTFDV